MGANTTIGEIGIYAENGTEFLLRPTFKAMASLGTPRELVELLACVLAPPRYHRALPAFNRYEANRHFRACCDVVSACCESDITALTGHPGSRWGSWVPGGASVRDITAIARSLVMHGMIGVLPGDEQKPRADDGAGSEELHMAEYVALAVAHLGLSEADAWGLTMTGFAMIAKAKFPPPKEAGSSAPTEAQHDHTMEWLAKINAQRDGVKTNG